MLNTTTMLIQYESGELEDHDVIELFAHLIETGLAWQLQGSYGRTATALIKEGFISEYGKILKYD